MMKLLDTSAIILFIDFIPQYNCINLLNSCGEVLLISNSVYLEYDIKNKKFMSENSSNYLLLNDYIKSNLIIKKEDCNFESLKKRYPILGAGELSIIAMAEYLEKKGFKYSCILDDKKANNIANHLNLKVEGSISLIRSLIRNKNSF